MNYLPKYLSSAVVEALGWTILHSLWQGALVAIILSVLMILLHRHSAKLRYGVATGALALVLALAVVTFIRLYEYAPSTVAANQATTLVEQLNNGNASVDNNAPATQISATTTKSGLLLSFKQYFDRNLPVVVLVWLLGLLVMLLKFLGGLAYTQRLKSYQTVPVAGDWEQKVLTLAQKLQVTQPVRLMQSYLVKTPMVIGFLKPAILLPVGTLAGLSVNQIEAILAHELAHISRKDYLLNLGQALVEILFFYHPAVWWISDYVRVEREHCCDDQAIAVCGDPLVYARALAQLETLAANASAPELALAFAGKDGSLLGRIKRLVQKQGLAPTFSEGFLAAFVVVFAFTAVSLSAFAGFKSSADLSLKTLPLKITDTAVAKNLSARVVPAEDMGSKASIYSFQDSIGKKSDLIIIKNKKGEITELFVNGKKIPKADIKDFSQMIEESMAATKNAPRLKPSEKSAQLNKTREAITKLEKDFEYTNKEEKDFNYNFNLNLDSNIADFNFENFKMPAIPVMPVVPEMNIFPPIPPVPPLPALVPRKPLEYLKEKNISDKAIYIIDGKKLSGAAGKKAVEKLNNNNIVLLEIFGPEKAFDRYGDEGKNGVVVLKTAKGTQNKVTIRDYTGKGDDVNEWVWNQNNQRSQFNEERLEQQHQRLRQITEERQKIQEQRMQEHSVRQKEHEARMEDHAERMKDHEARMKEHEKRMARLEEVKKQLIADKIINADDKEFSFRISNEGLYINDKKQPEAVYQKYLKLYYPDGKKPTGTFNDSFRVN